jgi:hypothetical protein
LTPGTEYAQTRPLPKEWYEGWADDLDEGGVILQRSASKPNLDDGPKSANIGDVGGQGYNSADLTASVGTFTDSEQQHLSCSVLESALVKSIRVFWHSCCLWQDMQLVQTQGTVEQL